ncbi:MAG: hydroxysqualene dehydroxylase HpnE [Acidobacteriia bacterium]|nr:hydroxysqualene dehydroxylase HpnE [Terriglobia bacterium]
MIAHNAPTVAVVGGGLAGLSAGCALAGAGFRVSLFERRPYLGGRASSYQHPATGEVVDNCQHVLLGCCTNLLDFYRRIGAADKIRWYRRLTFIEPGGRRSLIEPGLLPAPFHSAGSFLRAPCLSLGDKTAIARAMLALAARLPDDNGDPFFDWLHARGQTQRAIDRFWRVVLVSALNEDLERVSSRYAAQVFRESFLKSAQAGALGLPALPLSDLYGIAGDYILQQGGAVAMRASVDSFRADANQVRICASGRDFACDYAVLAVPFQALPGIIPRDEDEDDLSAALRSMLDRFETSPITGIHLWFDRQITDLPHAVLLDRTIQWMFHKSEILDRSGSTPASMPDANAGAADLSPGRKPRVSNNRDSESRRDGTRGGYIELVVSSSKNLVEKSKQEILNLAMRELAEFFPEANHARLLKSAVIKEVNATYAPLPGTDAHRPAQVSPWPRVFLAGDWTATGWPATMEGAVRSGYLAAEALTTRSGRPQRFLVPDLPARGFMRLLGK